MYSQIDANWKDSMSAMKCEYGEHRCQGLFILFAALIKALESKLTASAFAKEQRMLMTKNCVISLRIVITLHAATAETPHIKNQTFFWR